MKSQEWKLYPKIEYTPRDTPQYNSRVEVGFATLAAQSKAMMNKANVPFAKRYKVWYKAADTATKLDGLVPITIDGVTKTRDEHWGGSIPSFAKYL